MKRYIYSTTTNRFGDLSKYYKKATSGEYDDPETDEEFAKILEEYGLHFEGWAVAKTRYFDTLADDGIETVVIATDKSGAIGLYYIYGPFYDYRVTPVTVAEVERVLDRRRW